ncbi:RHS repeat domain-containing protein [Phocaeicola sartorii]|uniref:RHS repeat domain-containing protein n=1 Tax=Phocaeicola sartorii TaxID=671267 RepID=UPI00248C4F1D|nr:RHS repeat domain-containing protein [Phocaeicola sartorii]
MKELTMYKKIINALICCFVPWLLQAQNSLTSYEVAARSTAFYPASVQAAELFKKKPESIDYATGRATIRIPLYTIHTPSFTLPISLTYTTGGIKTDQKDGLVALGWTLEAEPMISREVRGMPDEQSFVWDKSNLNNYSDTYKAKVGQGTCDLLEDIFHIKLINNSVDFVLQQADQMKFNPRMLHATPLKISLGNGEDKVVSSFRNPLIVTDDAGNSYCFGKDDSSREETNLLTTYQTVTSWKASEITSLDGEKITFNYYSSMPDEINYGRYDYYAVEDNYPDYHVPGPNTPPQSGYWKGVNNKEDFYYINGVDLRPDGTYIPKFEKWSKVAGRPYFGSIASVAVRPIHTISFNGGTITFIYDSTTHTLESIKVQSNKEIIRVISFTKRKTGHGRILLESVNISDGSGKVAEKFRMDYYGGDYDRNTKAVDYWGYYNGKTSNTDWIPRQTATIRYGGRSYAVEIGGADKSGNLSSACTYSLEKITYPGGGSTLYTYDLSRIKDLDKPEGYITGGGLRIKEIQDNPVVGHPVRRVFRYYSGDKAEGIGCTRFPMCNLAYRQKMIKYYVDGSETAPDIRSMDYMLYSHTNSVTADQNVYFDKVIEYTNPIIKWDEGTPTYLGESVVHHYYNETLWEDFFYTDIANIRFIDEPINNQVLLSRELSADNINYAIKASTDFSSKNYNFRQIGNLQRLSLIEGVTGNMVMNNSRVRALYGESYRYSSGKDYAVIENEEGSRATTIYHDKNELKKYHSNEYEAAYHQVRQTKTATSSGTEDRVVYTYPFDQSGDAERKMLAANDVSSPVKIQYYSGGKLQKTVRYRYAPDSTNRGYSLSVIEESTDEGNSAFRNVETYSRYLKCGRPCQSTSRDGVVTAYLWAYGGKNVIAIARNLPVSVFESAGIQLENLSGNQDVGSAIYAIIENVRRAHPEAQVSTFRYRPLVGMIQRTEPDGTSTYYEYDSLGRVTAIKDTNSTKLSIIEYHEVNP